jgi:type II secretory ATPase GspE/PulE/Tfp pilus assembly ATPase PilB-like protein
MSASEPILANLSPSDPEYASRAVDRLLAAAATAKASDLHLQATADGLDARLRIDGVLQPMAVIPKSVAPNVIARLKVLAELLTYRTDLPQEGRIRCGGRSSKSVAQEKGGVKGDSPVFAATTLRAVPETGTVPDVEMRVSTFPTLFGERAVVRFFGRGRQYERLADLGLHDDLLQPLEELLSETAGAIIIAGPAGSGKTTTVYACLRELSARAAGARSLVTLEDPIEVVVPGVAQSQVNAAAGLDLATGLRFLMRQDPEVIMVGEIRDRATAEAAMQASLTGHLLLSTFHAGSAVETLGRLLDMGIEPYVLRSGLLGVICQRLLRRLCTCAEEIGDPQELLGLPVARGMRPVGCEECGGSGYRGRILLAEMIALKPTVAAELGRAILARADTTVLGPLAAGAGMVTHLQRAIQAVENGLTSPAEVRRIFGFGLR